MTRARLVETAPAAKGWTRHAARMCARALALAARGRVGLALVDEARARALNARFRGAREAADVLAFPAGPLARGEAAPAAGYLGDVAVCAQRCLRDAARLRRPWPLHAARLGAHAGLHLRGMTHDAPRTARRMARAEARTLAVLGHGPPTPRLVPRA